MSRTSEDKVKQLCGTALDESAITPFVGIANTFVTSNLAAKGLGDDELAQLETMLAAHFFSMARDRGIAVEDLGDGSWTFDGKTAMGFDATMYGQMAKTYDRSGTLRDLERTGQVVVIKALSVRDE